MLSPLHKSTAAQMNNTNECFVTGTHEVYLLITSILELSVYLLFCFFLCRDSCGFSDFFLFL